MTKTTIILLAVALYPANVAHSTTTRPTQRQIDRMAEAEYGLPRGVLARHRRYERAQRREYPRPWNSGRGAVCGRHQVLIWDRTSRDGKRLCQLVKGRGGAAWAAAWLMADSRRWCAARPGKCACPEARINFGDQTRLCARLMAGKQGDES